MNEKKQAKTETPCGQDCACHMEPDTCQCEEVKTYGMVCVTCGKQYQIKTRWTTDGSAGEWHGDK
jgi:hypothetical protein